MQQPMKKIVVTRSSQAEDDVIIDRFRQDTPWGMTVCIDIYGCDPGMIQDEKTIRIFLQKVVEFIKMKTYGEPLIKNFGPTSRLYGYSAIQLIETSSIVVHFSPENKSAHVDIFSCKEFRPNAAGVFCKQFFKACELVVSQIVFRF